jgi:hypothetical protein
MLYTENMNAKLMIHFRRILLMMILFISVAFSVFPQTGDFAMAEKYVLWASDLVKNNQWAEAEAGLERAADFATISSDLSYLLALCRNQLKRPRGAVLYALDLAISTDRWANYEKSSALLLQAETYLALKRYPFVIYLVNQLPQSAETMLLHLRALNGLSDHSAFLRLMKQSLNIYEHDPRFVSILFRSVDARIPQPNERELVDLALRRLSFLVEKDATLAYKAIPFLRNTEDARRLVQNYRAKNLPLPESLPAALHLGVIDEETMMREFFSYTDNQYSAINQDENVLNLQLVLELWNLLRNDESRNEFTRNLLSFSGVIVKDSNNDSYPESFTRYDKGTIQLFDFDVDQDGLSELTLRFSAGNTLPQSAELEVPEDEMAEIVAYHVKAEDQEKIFLNYFDYPSVENVRLGETEYFMAYRNFFFNPVDFVPIVENGDDFANVPYYPALLDSSIPNITKRSLISFSNIIKRPSQEFPEAVEEIHLTNSIVNRAREVLPDGTIVSEMYFMFGEPHFQYVDLDMNGRLETRRQFLRGNESDLQREDPIDYHPVLEKSESDFDGDDISEYGELYLEDGTIERSWDNNGDGIRESKEVKSDV